MSQKLYRASLLAALVSLLTSCAAITPQLRAQPTECLQPVITQPCTLRPEFVNLELPDQAAMVLACEVVNAQIRREWQRKHGCLAEWILHGE